MNNLQVKDFAHLFFGSIYQYLQNKNRTIYIWTKPNENARVPRNHIDSQGILVLNISAHSITNLIVDEDSIAFTARFNGTPFKIDLDMTDIMAMGSKEGDIVFSYPFAQPIIAVLPNEASISEPGSVDMSSVKQETVQEPSKRERPKFTVIQGGKS